MSPARYLLDTSIFSQPLRKSRVEAALRRWAEVGDDACVISAVTIAEVEWGLYKQPVSWRWKLYEEKLQTRLRVLSTDTAIWKQFSQMKAVQFALGRTVPDLDLLIAATTVHHDLHLATLNWRHFQSIQGLVVENWGEDWGED